MVTKAGKHTYGRERFFASLDGQPVPGLAFSARSLIGIQQRRSFPSPLEPVVRTAAAKAAADAKRVATMAAPPVGKRKPGRPQGRTAAVKAAVPLTPERTRLPPLRGAVLARSGTRGPVPSLVREGHCGNNNARQMARRCHRHLIAKRRADSAVYRPYTGP